MGGHHPGMNATVKTVSLTPGFSPRKPCETVLPPFVVVVKKGRQSFAPILAPFTTPLCAFHPLRQE